MTAKDEPQISKICVGVVLYKTDLKGIRLMLRSISHQEKLDGVELNVSIHSNDNIDRTADVIAIRSELDLARINNIEVTRSTNIGFGAAHNLIARRIRDANSTLYVGANPDGFFHRGALNCFLKAVERHGLEALFEARQFPQEHPKVYDHFSGMTAWASGACFAINVEYFHFIGGFDEAFFMYCEDVDLSWRVRAAGGKCIMVGDAMFYHDTSDDREHHWVRIEMLKSGRILAKKWGCASFAEVMEDELVRLGVADSRFTLPRLGVEPVSISQRKAEEVTEFRRLFSFSPTRW